MGDTGTQPSTDELLERLLESASPESYLQSLPSFDRSFNGLLTKVASAKGRSRAEVIRRSGVTTSYGYQVFSGARQPSRDVAVMLALGAGATLKETQDLLTRAGLGRLWAKDPRDAVVMFGIERGWDRVKIDDCLFNAGLPTLLKAE